jgi:hypothetical protein
LSYGCGLIEESQCSLSVKKGHAGKNLRGSQR